MLSGRCGRETDESYTGASPARFRPGEMFLGLAVFTRHLGS